MRIDPCAPQRGLKLRKNEMLLRSRVSAMSTSRLAQPLLISLLALAFFCQPGYAKKGDRVPLSPKILQSKSVSSTATAARRWPARCGALYQKCSIGGAIN